MVHFERVKGGIGYPGAPGPPVQIRADRSRGLLLCSKLWVNNGRFGSRVLWVAPGFGSDRPEHPRVPTGEEGGGKEQGRSSQRCLGHFWCWPWPCISLESPSRHACGTASRRRVARGAALGATLATTTAAPARPMGTPLRFGERVGSDGERWGREPGAAVAAPRMVSRHGAEQGLARAALAPLRASVSPSVE